MNVPSHLPAGVVDAVLADASESPGPALVGIGGAVAIGKSTTAASLAHALEARGRIVQVVGTDNFLYPNAVLGERGLSMKKGFPETFDEGALCECLAGVRAGGHVQAPRYSHETYDILPGADITVGGADVTIVEGVNALQPAVAAQLDCAVYLDAPEPLVRGWFIERFKRLTDDARRDESSFYRRFVSMGQGELSDFAGSVWDSINAPNLHMHISGTRSNASLVLTKAEGHVIAAIERQATV